MEWTDEGIVLGVRRLGEGSVIAELLTREHGRHLGVVRGGTGARMRPVLQPGNTVRAVWRARLDEHLGNYMLEALTLRAANLMTSSHAVYGVTHLGTLVRLLPERDPHENIFEMVEGALDDFDDARHAATHLARFELAMLAELGFGLDLSSCAATGVTEDLIYVSPKSGRAVSRRAVRERVRCEARCSSERRADQFPVGYRQRAHRLPGGDVGSSSGFGSRFGNRFH